MPDRMRLERDRGQASIELIAGIPVLLLCGAVGMQLLLAGYTLSLADGASEAGAAAAAIGSSPRIAARKFLPEWARSRARIETKGGRVSVSITPPAAVSSLARGLEVESRAWALPDPSPAEEAPGR